MGNTGKELTKNEKLSSLVCVMKILYLLQHQCPENSLKISKGLTFTTVASG